MLQDANYTKNTNSIAGSRIPSVYNTSNKADRKTESTKSILLKESNRNVSNFNDIYSLPEKEMEKINDKYNDLYNYIEANKDKIEKIEKYDETIKENLVLKQKLETITKSNEYLENNQLYAETLVK